MTVTRPDVDGRPVELLELGPEEQRELPRWARRVLAGGVAAALVLAVGTEVADRVEQHRLEQRQADALDLRPGEGSGGPLDGQVTLSVGLRNDGPRAVRLRDPRLTAEGLEGDVSVTAPEVVAAGAQASLSATFDAVCPAPDLTTSRVSMSVTAIADSGREQRVELEVTSLQALLEAACRRPRPADDLLVEVGSVRRDGDALRVALVLSTGSGDEGELVAVSSRAFAVGGFDGPVRVLGAGSTGIELVLSRPVCGAVERLPGGVRVPVALAVRAVSDRSGAGDGQGPRFDGRQPDLDAAGAAGVVADRDLAVDAGVVGGELARLAAALVTDTCP
ncbi:MAG: hypothetical protein Q8R60_17585 [Mycobacteriales bacterium]|nr:hypothetical protein [Mycobacteriales bacterium]